MSNKPSWLKKAKRQRAKELRSERIARLYRAARAEVKPYLTEEKDKRLYEVFEGQSVGEVVKVKDAAKERMIVDEFKRAMIARFGG